VAQPGSAPALGAGGPQFESERPDQCFQCFANVRARSSAFGTDALVLKGAPIQAFRLAPYANPSTKSPHFSLNAGRKTSTYLR